MKTLLTIFFAIVFVLGISYSDANIGDKKEAGVSFFTTVNARMEEPEPTVRCACSVFGHRCKARKHGAYCGAAPCADHSDTNC